MLPLGKQRKTRPIFPTILAVCILLIVSSTICIFLYYPHIIPEPTPTPSPTQMVKTNTPIPLTTVAPTNTPTQASTSTSTPTVSPTLTPTPNPTLSPTHTLPPTLTPTPTSSEEIYSFSFVDGLGNGARYERSNASEYNHSVRLFQGDTLIVPADLPESGNYQLFIRYSNDNYGPLEEISVKLDDNEILRFEAQDTGDGGNGWNYFRLSSMSETIELLEKEHTVQVTVTEESGDGDGVEIDTVFFLPVPHKRILEDFEGDFKLDWWTSTEGITYEEGTEEIKVLYVNNGVSRQIGTTLPEGLQDFSGATKLEFDIKGAVKISIKMEDEDNNIFEFAGQYTQLSSEWDSLAFDLTEAQDSIDLTRIDYLMFFIDPDSPDTSGSFLLNNIRLRNP